MPVCVVGCVPVRGVSVCVCVHGIARGAESRRRHWGRAGPPPGSGHPGVPAHTAPRHRPPPWCRLTSEYDYESGEWMRRRSVGASLGGFSHLSLAALPGRRRGIAPGRRGSRSIRHRIRKHATSREDFLRRLRLCCSGDWRDIRAHDSAPHHNCISQSSETLSYNCKVKFCNIAHAHTTG